MNDFITASNATPPGVSPWVAAVIAIISLVTGGGGLAAITKARADKKLGVAQVEISEDDAQNARWNAIIKAQTDSLLTPLRERLGEVESKVKALELELAESRRKYWSAISYIRQLITWFARNTPDEILERTAVPPPPVHLVDDL